MRHTFTILAGLLLMACAGLRQRDELLPIMAKSWVELEEFAVAGAPAELLPSVQAVKPALESGDRYQVTLLPWDDIRAALEAGIASQAEVAARGSLRESVRLFDIAWKKLGER